jgi:branched-chain amino acid transport system ATP-binding protein
MNDTMSAPVAKATALVLQLKDVHTFYGAIEALKGISVDVHQGEIVTLIGANGAGKSTTLKTISGLLTPRRGEIIFMGERISGLKVHQVAARQIVQVPEGRRIFPRMSVEENLEMGAFLRTKDAAGVKASMEHVYELFPRLKERRAQKGGTLSGGEQQMLAMGRGLMGSPKLLMLDEPSILLVEQNAAMALSIADRGYVLETGHIALHGAGKDLLHNEQVRKTYLGES